MRILTRIPWILLLLIIGVAWCIRPVSDTDILWHLRTGEWMLAHGDVIRHDIFSATRLGCEWVSVPWLYEVMIARLHALLGWGGITLWQVAMLVVITLQTSLLVWLLRREGRAGAPVENVYTTVSSLADAGARVPPKSCDGAMASRWDWRWPFLSVPAALAVLLTLRLLQMRINCRPEWFSYLFIGSFLVLLTVARQNLKSQISNCKCSGLVLWLLPILQILWTNTHGAFIIGPLLVWGYATAAWVMWGLARDHARAPVPMRITLVAILTTLACLATPYGLAGTFYPFHLFQVLTDPLYKTGIVEARPVDLSTALDSGGLGYAFLACWVFAGLGLLGRVMEAVRQANREQLAARSDQFSVISEPGRSFQPELLRTARGLLVTTRYILNLAESSTLGLGYLFACVSMAYLSLSAVRNVPLLPLVVAPLVASGIEYAADGLAALAAKLFFFVCGRPWRVAQFGRAGPPDPPKAEVLPLPCRCGGSGGPALPGERGVDLLHSRPAHILAQVVLVLGLLCTYRAVVSERFYDALGWRMRFAIGASDHEHPLAACDFVARHRGEITCRTLYGDTRSANLFLARFGPQWPVYFDGRHAEIYDPPIFRLAARTRSEPETFAQEASTYGITLVCFALADLKEDRSPLAVALGQTNSWQLVYLDDSAALFAAKTPANAPFVSRYGLPCAPTNATQQRVLFTAWLERQGRASLAALNDPANRALDATGVAGGVVHALQLGGWWAPVRELEPLRFCRLAAFLNHLGWSVVADDLYEEALRWPGALPVTLPRAIRQAQAVRQGVADPALQVEMYHRIDQRAQELQRVVRHSPMAEAALAVLATNAPALQR